MHRGVAAVIVGIGTDICDLRRMRAALERRGDRFAERVLGVHELAVFQARRQRAAARGVAYLASRFSAKEAFSKAIGLGIRSPMNWRSCEILNEPSGKPIVCLSGELAEWFDRKAWKAHVTLSDETDFAVSFVIVETKGAFDG